MASNENESEAEDAFERGFHGIPSDQKLRAMSYVKLASLLASCERGSARYLVVEREKLRRDALELAPSRPEKVLAEEPRGISKQSSGNWYDKPIGRIAIGVVTGVLVFLTVYLIQHYIVAA